MTLTGRDLVMQRPEAGLLFPRDRSVHRNEEVAVAVDVRIADREGTLQVRADEVAPENAHCTQGQLFEERVELGELCRVRLNAAPLVIHLGGRPEVTLRW